MEWMLLPLKRYSDFSGRSRRMEYWMFQVFNALVLLAIGLIFGLLGYATGAFNSGSSEPPVFLMVIGGILILAWLAVFLVPSIAVTVRRLHDRDMSGWWYLGAVVVGIIPFIGYIASIGFTVLMFLPGTPGPNRFGPDPKDPTSASVFA
jgi:uncharacterized membrane protein YhaH (DUF805 family)